MIINIKEAVLCNIAFMPDDSMLRVSIGQDRSRRRVNLAVKVESSLQREVTIVLFY